MKRKILAFIWTIIRVLLVIGIIFIIIWQVGLLTKWSWGDFWSNFISNAISSAIIGYILYMAITRPDEQKENIKRCNQALSMLKFEFKLNLDRARKYSEALKNPKRNLGGLYPLRFTRGAWNALKESGFLPQFDDVPFVYELLRVNEVIVVADSTLSKVERLTAENKKTNLNKYAKKAVEECSQLEAYLIPILVKLEAMNLPEVNLRGIEIGFANTDDEVNDVAPSV